ncbi:hypothetical protein GCM10022223_20080 [Kineosporia mesophila]|uniref:Uncharacterized protein n=1 Tax=Kineosporia mesophila TaxID=566012 RepID=A0ABP6ZCM7_9ACTN
MALLQIAATSADAPIAGVLAAMESKFPVSAISRAYNELLSEDLIVVTGHNKFARR